MTVDTFYFQAEATLVAHTDRVNSVRWVDGAAAPTFVSTSTDGTAIVWVDRQPIHSLKGHAASVTVASAVSLSGGKDVLVVTTGGDSTIKIWHIQEVGSSPEIEACQTIKIGRGGFAMDLRVALLRGRIPVVFAAQDDCKIHVYAPTDEENLFSSLSEVHGLAGHEDWSQSLDCCVANEEGDLLLASGCQDCFVRVWRLCHRDKDQILTKRKKVDELGDGEDIKVKEEVFGVLDGEENFAVSLETVLAGHEDKVFSVQWRPRYEIHVILNLLDSQSSCFCLDPL